MKHFLFLLSFLSAITAMGQVTVTVKPADTIVCYNDSIVFTAVVTGAGSNTVGYTWQQNFIPISGATSSVYSIKHVKSGSPGLYHCVAIVAGGSYTSNDAHLRMHPRLKLDTLYRYNALGCAKECKGQFKALVSGGTPSKIYPPYVYDWHGGFSQDTIVFGLCRGEYPLNVTDSLGCSLDTSYIVRALISPKIDFDILPRDTVYLTNPKVQVTFPDSMKKYITNWTWNFGDSTRIPNLNPAFHTYKRTGEFIDSLTFTDLNGCDTTITHKLTVKVADLTITDLITPNGDGYNDTFKVRLKDGTPSDDFRIAYLSNEFMVFDRWGKKVFDKKDYKSEDWDGGNLADGTYFYILHCVGQYGNEVFKGSVTLLREK